MQLMPEQMTTHAKSLEKVHRTIGEAEEKVASTAATFTELLETLEVTEAERLDPKALDPSQQQAAKPINNEQETSEVDANADEKSEALLPKDPKTGANSTSISLDLNRLEVLKEQETHHPSYEVPEPFALVKANRADQFPASKQLPMTEADLKDSFVETDDIRFMTPTGTEPVPKLANLEHKRTPQFSIAHQNYPEKENGPSFASENIQPKALPMANADPAINRLVQTQQRGETQLKEALALSKVANELHDLPSQTTSTRLTDTILSTSTEQNTKTQSIRPTRMLSDVPEAQSYLKRIDSVGVPASLTQTPATFEPEDVSMNALVNEITREAGFSLGTTTQDLKIKTETLTQPDRLERMVRQNTDDPTAVTKAQYLSAPSTALATPMGPVQSAHLLSPFQLVSTPDPLIQSVIEVSLAPASQQAPTIATSTPVIANQNSVSINNLAHFIDTAVTVREIGGKIDVALKPDDLGRLAIKIEPTLNGTQITFTAERADTQDLMRRQIDVLYQQFKNQGFENLTFSFTGSEQSFEEHDFEDSVSEQTDQTLTEPQTVTLASHQTISSGLDIRV